MDGWEDKFGLIGGQIERRDGLHGGHSNLIILDRLMFWALPIVSG